MPNRSVRKLKGFSLFELLITMGILIILGMIVFPLAVQKAQQSKLENYASQLTTDLYFQQQESFFKGVHKGVTIESNGYVLFDGESLSVATESYSNNYPNNIKSHSISFSLGNEIVFPGGELEPSSYGAVIISDDFNLVRVYINQEGLVGYERL